MTDDEIEVEVQIPSDWPEGEDVVIRLNEDGTPNLSTPPQVMKEWMDKMLGENESQRAAHRRNWWRKVKGWCRK